MRAPWHRGSLATARQGSDHRRRGLMASGGRGLKVTAAAGVLSVVAAACYDPGLGLLLLVAVAAACLLHVTVIYLADVGLLWPVVALVGCIGIALWVFLPDNLDIRGGIFARAPAPVGRLLEPILRRIAAAGDMTLTAAPSPDARGSAAQVAGAGAKSPASSVVRTGTQSVKRGATVGIVLTQSSPVSVRGTPVVFTVAVRPVKGARGSPLGRVELIDGRSRVLTADLIPGNDGSRAVFTVPSLAVGNHVLAARYGGTAGFAPATSAVLVHTVDPER